MSSAALASTYDALPYISRALQQTHPDALAVAARLRGMSPAPVEECRVLELGCASGGNLLPMAESLPRSRFVGVDLSARQIDEGQGILRELGIQNLELHAADLMTLDHSIGQFDYIICHGVYSWVPEPVQQRILSICSQHLAPHGVAYISYNIHPGFHRRQAFREMMRYHTAEIADPVEATKQSRALLEFLLQNAGDESSTNARMLRDELDKIRALPPAYLFHEHLEPYNSPCYFHEFMARASGHGLQFLAEAEGKGGIELLPEEAQQALSGLGHDIVRREQYIDFLRNSTLRSTLLCHRQLTLGHELSPHQMRDFLVLCGAAPEREVSEPIDSQPLRFRSRLGSATVEHPGFKALLLTLHRARPRPLRVSELWAQLAQLLPVPPSVDDICEMVLEAYRRGLLALHTRGPRLAAAVSDRPCATPLARLQARRGLGVSSLWHHAIATNSIDRQVLQRLDGTRELQALCAEIIAAIPAVDWQDQPDVARNAATAQQWMPSLCTQVLGHLYTSALLES